MGAGRGVDGDGRSTDWVVSANAAQTVPCRVVHRERVSFC